MRFVFIILAIFHSCFVFSQNQPLTYDKSHYYRKGVRQQNTGFLLLGIGSLMVVGGYHRFQHSNLWNNEWGAPVALMISGGAVVASSVPFFILGAKNKGISRGMAGIKAVPSFIYNVNRPSYTTGIYISWPIRHKNKFSSE